MAEESDHQHLARIFSLLDCFSVDKPEIGVREAARLTGISSSTCGRLLGELREIGVLVQNDETRSYSLGGRVMRWANVYSATSDLRRTAFPIMERIYNQTNETVTLYSCEEYDRVCVERLESRRNVRIVETVGTRIKIYRGSGGKAILAFRPQEEIEKVLTYAEAQHEGDDIDKLREELKEIRKTGYAISHGEWQSDASGIGSPIFNEKGIPVGSISISGPTQRFLDNDKLRFYAELLLENVGEISRKLGYFG